MKTIAKIHNDFPTKFGIPRQSGLVEKLKSKIIFEPDFRNPDALRGLCDFSHIWLIWEFSENVSEDFSPTVRPPRLGGNKRVGVFATRSPFRPNPIGLSCVKLDSIEKTEKHGYILNVSGADLMDGTPILDIKPYLPISDCKPDATSGFAEFTAEDKIKNVDFSQCEEEIPTALKESLIPILQGDPRPSYQNDENRIYGFKYAGYEIKFKVSGNTVYLIKVINEGYE